MTVQTAARTKEAEQAATAYQLALSRLGVQTVAEAIALWDHVPPGSKPSVAAAWLNAAVQLIMGRRTQSVQLARAYYRLARALSTGHTVADPNHPDPTNVTLGDLRRQFGQLAGSTGSLPHPAVDPGSQSGQPQNGSQARAGAHESDTSEDDDEAILIEELERLAELEAENERLAEREIRTALGQLGPANQIRLIGELDNEQPASTVDQQRNAAHDQAGARQAAAAARIAMNGARSSIWTMQESDGRAMGYIRVSTTGTPCGWCAMLISRGAVYKASRGDFHKANARGEYEDGDKYHDNCYCITVPVFTDADLSSSKFELNRLYADLWPKVTAGLGGKDALAAWRRFIRAEQAASKKPSPRRRAA